MKSPYVLAFLLALTSFQARAQQTTAERTDYQQTSSYGEVLGFLDSLERRTPDLRRWTLARSPQGKAIPVVLLARPMVDGPSSAHRSGKPIIYLQANIHAGEIEGKEAAQMLLRDLSAGPLSSLLDSVILLVVPVYNADGNERMAPGNRPGQNGPATVGERANGQGYDLNRDYVKLEAPETNGALALLNSWDPDIFIDLHTTNGSYHGYLLTYSPGLNPNSPPANDYIRDRFLPTLRDRMRRRHRQETFWYGNFRNQAPDSLAQGWETYDARPRFGTNLAGLRGRMPILSEAYSNAPFRDRVRVTYNFVREILSLAAEQRATIKSLTGSSERFAPDSIATRSALGAAMEQDVVAEVTEPEGDGAGPYAHRRRTGVYRTIRMPVYDRFVAARKEARPEGYLLPPEYSRLAGLLVSQGVIVERFRSDWRGSVEGFQVDSVSASRGAFEGHRTVSVEGSWSRREGSAGPGWFYVSTRQRLGVMAGYFLEPESEDGYVTWNLLDQVLRPRSEYPILRVRQALKANLEIVNHAQAW